MVTMAAREAKAARAVVTPGRVAGGDMFVFDVVMNAATAKIYQLLYLPICSCISFHGPTRRGVRYLRSMFPFPTDGAIVLEGVSESGFRAESIRPWPSRLESICRLMD